MSRSAIAGDFANELDSPVLSPQDRDLEKDEPEFGFEPIHSTSRPATTSQSRSLYATRSRQSFGGEDGYSVRRGEDGEDDGLPIDVEASPETKEEKEFDVKWDGDDDSMNPRCKKKWRKWSIVIIVAACSLCV